MTTMKIKVGGYYELRVRDNRTIAFAVMYGFKDGKNKDVYALMMYTPEKVFEFPVHEQLFEQWVDEGKIREITSEEAFTYIL
jgi:hypothetical protein